MPTRDARGSSDFSWKTDAVLQHKERSLRLSLDARLLVQQTPISHRGPIDCSAFVLCLAFTHGSKAYMPLLDFLCATLPLLRASIGICVRHGPGAYGAYVEKDTMRHKFGAYGT
jgi:hypothetical protein